MLKEKLKNTCSFLQVWEEKGEERYPKCELCYIRAYIKGGQWWSSVFPIHWELKTAELVQEADAVYEAFKKAFPDLEAVCDYVEHDAEPMEGDPTEGNAYLEMEYGRYWLRMITRRGDYNLYLHVLSNVAMEEAVDEKG